jgi:hypothetical protein
MEFNDFPRTGPNALSAICASGVDDPYFGFHELDSVFRANADTAAAKIALAGNDVNHQGCVSCHWDLFTLI